MPTTPPTAAQLVANARQTVESLTPDQVDSEMAGGQALLVDLREAEERLQNGSIAGAIHAPRGMLQFYADPSSAYHRSSIRAGAPFCSVRPAAAPRSPPMP